MSSQLNKVRKFFAPEQGYDTSQPPPPPPKWLTEGLSRRQSSSSSEVKKAFERQPSYDDLAMGSFNEPSPFANPAVSRRKGNDTDIGEIDDELTSSLLESIGKRKSPGKAPEISRESSQHVSQIPPSELHTPPSPTAAYLPAASEGDDLDLDEPDQEPPTAPHYGGQHYEPNDGYAEEQQAPAYDQQAQEPYYSEQDYYAPDEQQAAADPYAAPAADYGYDNQAYPQQDMGYQEQEPYYEQQPQDAYGQQQDYSNYAYQEQPAEPEQPAARRDNDSMADFDLEEPEEVPPLKPDDTGSRMPGMESRHSPQPFAPFGTSPAAYSSDDMRKLPPQEGIAPAQEEYPRQEDGQYQEDSAFGGPHEHSPNDMGFPPAAQDDWEEAAPQEEEYQEQWDQSVPPQGAPMGTPQRDVLPYEQDLTPNALPTGLSGGGAPSSFYRQPSGDEWAKNFHEDTAIPQPPPASKTENYIAMPTPIRPELPSPPTPVKATQEEGREIDAVNMPQQASDPTFQQYSIANLKNRDESFAQGGTVEPAPEAPAPSSFDDMVAASALPQSPTANYHSAGEYESMYPHGVSQVPTSEKAVNADGVPRHIPDLPPPEVDYSAPSRRLAGAAWVLFSILLSLFFVYHNRMTLGSVFAAPAFLMGAIMLVAGRWSAVLAMLLGLAYGVFFGWVGYDLMYGQTYTTQYGFQDLPNTVAICFMLLGLLFVMGNLVMLPGTPGLGRAALGGFVVVLPAVALLIVQIMPTISSPSLGPPKGIEAAQEFGSTLEGLNFSKPAGWGQYPWEVAEKNFRFLDHLFQEPNYYFFNEKRTALVAFYLDERPTGASVLKSFLGQDSRTELENQVTAGLPQVNKERLYFEHEGRQFERRMYEGQLSNGRRIAVTVDKTPVAGKMLLMVVTRNAASEFNHDQAIAALDKFRESLQLQPE